MDSIRRESNWLFSEISMKGAASGWAQLTSFMREPASLSMKRSRTALVPQEQSDGLA